MTGPWEERLKNLAEGGSQWDLPARQTLISRLAALRYVLDKVASEPGLAGQSGDAATESFVSASADISDQISYLENELPRSINDANAERARAQGYLAQLGGGQLTPGQEAMVRGAAAGTTIVLGPMSILAGEGAVRAFNFFLGNQREDEAREAVETVSNNLDSMTIPAPPKPTVSNFETTDATPPGGSTPIDLGGGGPGASMGKYPDFDVKPSDTRLPDDIDPTIVVDPPTSLPENPDHTLPGDPIDLGTVPDDYTLTPDGPTTGIGALPGGGTLTGGGIGGGSAAGIGSGLGVGLVAGAGGAAALGRMGGIGLGGVGGGAAAGRGGVAAGRSGGLLGRGGAAGGAPGLGARGGAGGMAGIGGGAMGGAAGGRGTATGAGGRGGGLAGGAGGGAAAGGGARGTGTGGRGATGIAGGAGGRAGRADRDAQQGRGLGGPIAERMEDDEEFGPRSENAGSGERE